VANVVVAVAVLLAQIAGQRRENAKARISKQAAVGYFVETMAVRIVSAQSQAAELLRHAALQAGVVTARVGAEFVHAAEALIERLVVGKGREASVAHRLIAIQLDLIWLMHGARADVINAQRGAFDDPTLGQYAKQVWTQAFKVIRKNDRTGSTSGTITLRI